jgi:hypothetical protein
MVLASVVSEKAEVLRRAFYRILGNNQQHLQAIGIGKRQLLK